MKQVEVYVVGFEHDEFEKGRWALRANGFDGVLYCQSPDPWTDGRPFIGKSITGNFLIECGDGHGVEPGPHCLSTRRSTGLEGDWITARGTFRGMCTEEYMTRHYEIESVISVTADLDEKTPRPTFEPGQCVEFVGYLMFEISKS